MKAIHSSFLATGLMLACLAGATSAALAAGTTPNAGKQNPPTISLGASNASGSAGTPGVQNGASSGSPEERLFAFNDQTMDPSDSFMLKSEAEGNVGYNVSVTKKLFTW